MYHSPYKIVYKNWIKNKEQYEPKGAFLLTLHGTGPFLKCHIQGLSLHLFRANLQKGANLTRVI